MKKRDFLLKVGLWTCGFGSFSDGIVVPLTNLILQDFPNTSLFMRNMFLSGSAVPALIAALFSGLIINRIDKKKLLTIGSIMYLIAGVLGAFSTSVEFLVVTRVFDGLSDGILSVSAMSIIAEMFKDESERSHVMGGYNAVSALFGFITSTLSGILAVYSWRYAFLLNLVCIIGVILIIRYVPSFKPEPKESATVQKLSGRERIPVILNLIVFLCFGSLITQTYYLADIFVAEHRIGNSVQTGVLLSVLTICNLLASAVFGLAYKHIKNRFPILVFAMSALSLGLLYASYSFIPVAVAFGLAGAANAFAVVYYSMYISNTVPVNSLGLYMSLYTVVLYANGFLSPYISTAISSVFKMEHVSDTYLVSAVICVIFVLITTISSVKKRTGVIE